MIVIFNFIIAVIHLNCVPPLSNGTVAHICSPQTIYSSVAPWGW